MDIEKMNAELLKGAAECNIKKIKRLLSAGADINIQNNYGETPLFVAVWLNAPVNYIEMLIAAGADHSVRDMYGRTPLHSAAWNGRTQYIRLLLNAGADINARDKKGGTPLHAAARGGSVAAARVLLKAGADMCETDNEGRTMLDILKSRHPYKYTGSAAGLVRLSNKIKTCRLNDEDRIKTFDRGYEFDI